MKCDSQSPLYISDEALLQPTDAQVPWTVGTPRFLEYAGMLIFISGSQPGVYITTTWEIRTNPNAPATLQAN